MQKGPKMVKDIQGAWVTIFVTLQKRSQAIGDIFDFAINYRESIGSIGGQPHIITILSNALSAVGTRILHDTRFILG